MNRIRGRRKRHQCHCGIGTPSLDGAGEPAAALTIPVVRGIEGRKDAHPFLPLPAIVGNGTCAAVMLCSPRSACLNHCRHCAREISLCHILALDTPRHLHCPHATTRLVLFIIGRKRKRRVRQTSQRAPCLIRRDHIGIGVLDMFCRRLEEMVYCANGNVLCFFQLEVV